MKINENITPNTANKMLEFTFLKIVFNKTGIINHPINIKGT